MSGDFILMDGDYAQIQWGRKFNETFSAGTNLNYSRFNSVAGASNVTFAKNTSYTGGVRAGILASASTQLITGLVIDYTSGRSNGFMFDQGCFCSINGSDRNHSYAIRPGFTFEYLPQSSVYVDYVHARYTADAGKLISRSVLTGIEHRLVPGIFLRAGVAHDMRGSNGTTLGIGVNPSVTSSIDFAIQHNIFNELQPEFGTSNTVNLSANIAF